MPGYNDKIIYTILSPTPKQVINTLAFMCCTNIHNIFRKRFIHSMNGLYYVNVQKRESLKCSEVFKNKKSRLYYIHISFQTKVLQSIHDSIIKLLMRHIFQS